jgi:hypothetical protein
MLFLKPAFLSLASTVLQLSTVSSLSTAQDREGVSLSLNNSKDSHDGIVFLNLLVNGQPYVPDDKDIDCLFWNYPSSKYAIEFYENKESTKPYGRIRYNSTRHLFGVSTCNFQSSEILQIEVDRTVVAEGRGFFAGNDSFMKAVKV